LFIADVGNFRIRKVDTSGNITTVAGNGIEAASGDGGPATQASMYIPIRCVVDSTGNLYVTDQSGQKIRMINPSGTISTFAGTGANAGPHSIGLFSGDGGPSTADLNNPTAITVDSAGNIYFSDQCNQRIRKVDKNGIITTVAGNGTAGSLGDGGPDHVGGTQLSWRLGGRPEWRSLLL
jgi:sugar lactone lactonase YvrE